MTDESKKEPAKPVDATKVETKPFVATKTTETASTGTATPLLEQSKTPTAPVAPVINTAPPGSKAPPLPEEVQEGKQLVGQPQEIGTFAAPARIGDGSAEHFGEPGEGALDVGTDTMTEPGRSHGQQLEAAPLAQPRSHKNGRLRISDEQIRRMTPSELKAVATDRGYGDIEGGRHAVYAKFIAAQNGDDSLDEPSASPPEAPIHKESTVQPAKVAPSGTPVQI